MDDIGNYSLRTKPPKGTPCAFARAKPMSVRPNFRNPHWLQSTIDRVLDKAKAREEEGGSSSEDEDEEEKRRRQSGVQAFPLGQWTIVKGGGRGAILPAGGSVRARLACHSSVGRRSH